MGFEDNVDIFDVIWYLWRYLQRPKSESNNIVWLDDVIMERKWRGLR